MNRAARVAVPTLTIVVALAVPLIVVPMASGDPTQLPIARALVRVALDLAVAAVLGALVLAVRLPPAAPRRGRALDAAAAAAGVWALAAGGTAILLYLGDAPAVSAPEFGPGFVAFVSDIAIGRAWGIAAVSAAVLTALLVAVRSRTGVLLLLPGTAAALIPVALQSAVSGDSVGVQRAAASAELVQLVAVGAWLGAVLLLPPRRGSSRAGGSRTALLCAVLALAATAIGAAAQVQEGAPAGLLLLRGGVLLLAAVGTVALPPAARRAAVGILLGAATGFAAAATVLRSTPSSIGSRTTPAEILTGAPLPAPPSLGRLVTAWQPDALWLVLAGLLVAGYAAGLVAVRRDGGRWPVVRTVSWALGLALLVWLTCGGPAVYQEVLLSAHLLQHVALATTVPLLLAGAAPFRLLAVARRRDVRSDGRPVIPMAPAAALALAALLALYGTGLLHWSVTDALGGEWALVQCLLAGLLLAGAVRSGSRRSATRALVAVLAAEGVLAAVLVVGGGLLLPDWYGAMGWGVDARIDQRTGAVVAGVLALLSTAGLLAVRRPVEDGDRARGAAPVVLRDEVQA